MALFRCQGLQLGKTTLYRALERLQEEGLVVKIPSVEGQPAQYQYLDEDRQDCYGKLLCLQCGQMIALQCDCMDHFSAHIMEAHGFCLDQERTVLYGLCDRCRTQQTRGEQPS